MACSYVVDIEELGTAPRMVNIDVAVAEVLEIFDRQRVAADLVIAVLVDVLQIPAEQVRRW